MVVGRGSGVTSLLGTQLSATSQQPERAAIALPLMPVETPLLVEQTMLPTSDRSANVDAKVLATV